MLAALDLLADRVLEQSKASEAARDWRANRPRQATQDTFAKGWDLGMIPGLRPQFGITSNPDFSFCVVSRASVSKKPASPKLLAFVMIICSCNILSDHDVRDAVSAADDVLRHARQVHDCLGCSMECGRCARTIKTIIDETVAACAHRGTKADGAIEDEFALAAS